MNMPMRLDANERDRLLDLIGIERYVRRGTAAVVIEADVAATPVSTRLAEARPMVTDPPTRERQATSRPAARPSMIDELGLDARAPQVLVFVEAPRVPDPRDVRLLEAICRLLPPHQRLDASDTPARWPDTVLVLGRRLSVIEGTHLIEAPALPALRGNVTAKRALWQSIRRLRRSLQSS